MEDSEHQPSEDTDREIEARMLAAVKQFIPAVRVARNAAKVLRRLSSLASDSVAAALEASTSRSQLMKARNELHIARLAEVRSGQSAIGVRVAERLIEEQRRIDQLVIAAIEQVQGSSQPAPPEEGGAEIDDDWIESWRRGAAERSQGEMRETFARILAGEIRAPGTFSIKTLHTVGGLGQSTAHIFRKAASLRVGMELEISPGSPPHVLDARIPALGGQLGANCLLSEGLGYDHLINLTENGLLHSDYNSWNTYIPAMPHPEIGLKGGTIPFVHQGQRWALVPLPGFNAVSGLKIYGAKFTTVGQELLGIVDIESDAAFLTKVQGHLKSKRVEMVAPSTNAA